MKITLVLLIAISLCSDGAKILGIIPTASYSHQVAYQPLWRELSLKGHQVTVVTTDPMNDPALVNLTEIDLHFTYEHLDKIVRSFRESYLNGIDIYLKGMINISELQLKHPQLQKLFQDKSQTFDVLLIEFITPTFFALGERFKCPIIGITSLQAPSKAYRLLGSPAHPLLYSEINSPYGGKLNFYERLITTFFAIGISYVYSLYIPQMELVAKRQIGLENLDLHKAMDSIDMLFVTNNPTLNNIRPLTPNVIEIGGGLHIKPPKPLPLEVQNFLDNAKDGFIYFSMGTNVKFKDLSKSLVNTILQTFSKLPYKILWKYDEEDIAEIPPNVMTSKWLPQQNVLKHPNIKLFIYQCGWQSTEEAVLSKVPVLAIPILGDQSVNARIISDKGMGLSLSEDSITEHLLQSTIIELIRNPKFKIRMEELAKLMLDQPMTGLEKAVWWTEYVIRHKGAKHFKNSGADIPLYQYFFLDVIGFCVLVLAAVIFLLFIVLKFILKTLKCLNNRLKSKLD